MLAHEGGEGSSEFCMGLRPTYMDENRGEPKPLRWNRRGTAKTEPTLDLLRPFPSLVWVACFGPICVAPSVPGDGLVAREGV
jgi:hypothetical protein